MPKENMHYPCNVCVTNDSVMRMDKKNHPQVYLEECKYRVKKNQMSKFINAELESDSDSEAASEYEWHCTLMIIILDDFLWLFFENLSLINVVLTIRCFLLLIKKCMYYRGGGQNTKK